jgi:hypothetical protein
MINLKDVAGQTALIVAAIGGHAGCLEILRSSNLMNFPCYRIQSNSAMYLLLKMVLIYL